jgi:hypothetical protein
MTRSFIILEELQYIELNYTSSISWQIRRTLIKPSNIERSLTVLVYQS